MKFPGGFINQNLYLSRRKRQRYLMRCFLRFRDLFLSTGANMPKRTRQQFTVIKIILLAANMSFDSPQYLSNNEINGIYLLFLCCDIINLSNWSVLLLLFFFFFFLFSFAHKPKFTFDFRSSFSVFFSIFNNNVFVVSFIGTNVWQNPMVIKPFSKWGSLELILVGFQWTFFFCQK